MNKAAWVLGCYCFTTTAVAAEVCFPIAPFEVSLQGAEFKTEVVMKLSHGDGQFRWARISRHKDGRWIMYSIFEEVLACPFVVGEAWTEQTSIPRDDPRPQH